RRALLLCGDGEAVLLELAGERHRRAHAGVREGRRCGDQEACKSDRQCECETCLGFHSTSPCWKWIQRTWSVKGTVSTFPSSRHGRTSRHVPDAGTSTPTFSFPGVVEVPTTLVAPMTLVQPLTPGAQTCVWK